MLIQNLSSKFSISWKSNICFRKVAWNVYISLKIVHYRNILSLQCVPRSSIHDHDTRNASQIDSIYTCTHVAVKCTRSQLLLVLNNTPEVILSKINTHNIQGFSYFLQKKYDLSKYTTRCHEIACYVCNNWFHSFFQCAIIIIWSNIFYRSRPTTILGLVNRHMVAVIHRDQNSLISSSIFLTIIITITTIRSNDEKFPFQGLRKTFTGPMH